MLRVKNFIPSISLEGFEAANDGRRGAGVYQKVMDAMALLKSHKLPFGISTCYTCLLYTSPSHVFAATGRPKRELMGTLRVSFCPDSTREEAKALTEALTEIKNTRIAAG